MQFELKSIHIAAFVVSETIYPIVHFHGITHWSLLDLLLLVKVYLTFLLGSFLLYLLKHFLNIVQIDLLINLLNIADL